MRKTGTPAAAPLLCAMGLNALLLAASAKADPVSADTQDFPVLPLPPSIEGPIAFPRTFTKGRGIYMGLITREAERRGLPAALADAVAKVESDFDPNALGGVGEVGLMQVRPQTAAMLGYTGDAAGLFEPEVNVRYGVAYLARAWELAGGDVCRSLMKYRAGWGEERMTPLSVEYCRRARRHLAAIGSPLAGNASPEVTEAAPPSAVRPTDRIEQVSPPSSLRVPPARVRVASVGAVKLSDAQAQALSRAREQEKARAEKRRQIWAAHENRMNAITAKLKAPQLRIMSGL